MPATEKVTLGIVQIKDSITMVNTCLLGLNVKKRIDAAIILNLLRALKNIKKALDEIEKYKKTKDDEEMIQSIKEEISLSILPLEPVKTYDGGEFVFNFYREFKENV